MSRTDRGMRAATVALALPVVWLLGVDLSVAIAGKEVGQLPALLIPLAFFAALIFSLLPVVALQRRLKIMLGTCAVLAVASAMM